MNPQLKTLPRISTHYRDRPDEIRELFNQLMAAIKSEADHINSLRESPLGQVIDSAGYCREFYNELNELKEGLGSVVNEYSNKIIPERIIDLAVREDIPIDLAKTQRSHEYRATITERVSVSLVEKEKAIEWLKENGHSDLVKEQAHPQTLGMLVKELDLECLELPDDLFKVNRSFGTILTRIK